MERRLLYREILHPTAIKGYLFFSLSRSLQKNRGEKEPTYGLDKDRIHRGKIDKKDKWDVGKRRTFKGHGFSREIRMARGTCSRESNTLKVHQRKKELQTENGEENGREEGEDLDENSISRSSLGRWASSPHPLSFLPYGKKVWRAREKKKKKKKKKGGFFHPLLPTLPSLQRSLFLPRPPLFFSDGGRGAKGGKEDAVIRSFLPPASIPAPSAVAAVGGSDFPRLRLGGRKRRGRGKGWEEGASG